MAPFLASGMGPDAAPGSTPDGVVEGDRQQVPGRADR